MKKLFFSFIIVALLLTSCVYASENDEYNEFLPENLIFEYNDHNTSVYEGDSGLIMAYVNNVFDNNSYYLPTEYVRGMAYASKGTFKFNEPILFKHGPYREWDNMYVITGFKFINGSIIPYLGIEKDDLTREQKKYFDDYESQRQEYLMQQQEYAAEDFYDYETSKSKYNSRSKYSYYLGTGGSGVIYNPSSNYW